MITLDEDEVENPPRRPVKVQPRPATHVFSLRAWRKSNPSGEMKRAIAKAKEFGFEVTQ